MSSPAPTYVVDASVAIKWFLNDKDFVEQSQAVFNAYNTNAIRLIAPKHLILKIANTILSAKVQTTYFRRALKRDYAGETGAPTHFEAARIC